MEEQIRSCEQTKQVVAWFETGLHDDHIKSWKSRSDHVNKLSKLALGLKLAFTMTAFQSHQIIMMKAYPVPAEIRTARNKAFVSYEVVSDHAKSCKIRL